MTSRRFSSAYRRIAWADDHIRDLQKIWLEFASKENGRTIEIEPKTAHSIDKVRFSGPFPEDYAVRLTVQAIENLRSALDHATCAVVPRQRRKRTAFPFGDTKREFIDILGSKSKHVPDEIKSFFRTLKPYKTGNPPLWALNKLCNTGKHRDIITLGLNVQDILFQNTSTGWFGTLLYRPRWDSSKNEIVISKAPGKGTSHHDLKLSLCIAFGKVPLYSGVPVLAALRYLAGMVNSIVMGIEAEAARIGLN